MTLEVGPESSAEVMNASATFNHLVALLGVMKHASGKVDRELVLPFLLYEGWADGFIDY